MFGVGNEEWWGRLWKQTGGFADRRQNWQDDTVQSSTLAQLRRGNVAPEEQFWTRCAFWLVASVARHGWQPRFRWTLLCSEPGEQQNSARTEAGREDMNTIYTVKSHAYNAATAFRYNSGWSGIVSSMQQERLSWQSSPPKNFDVTLISTKICITKS